MQQACGKVVDNDYTIEDLLPYLEVQKMSFKDAPQVINIINQAFKIGSDREAFRQLLYTNADLNNSVKVVDTRTNTIYGVLIFCNHPIHRGSPLLHYSHRLTEILSEYNQLHGFAFILDERLRGRGFDKQMLSFNQDYIDKFDFIWCAVENDLMTHNYWKRMGFSEILRIQEAVFYLKLLNKSILPDIYKKIHDYQQL